MDDISRIRNIGVAAHIDAGKTTTTERLLFYSGTIHRMGNVDDGTTVTDFDSEEQKRGITIYSAAVSFNWRDCRVNLIDTPGHVDFTAEVERSLRVLDGAVVVFDAKEGVEAQSETVWRQADKYHVPRICLINKIDKVGADFENAVQTIRDRLDGNPIPIQIPIGTEDTFRGFVDLIEMNATVFSGTGQQTRAEQVEIPDELRAAAEAAREHLVEQVAELDEDLMAHYLEHETLEPEQIRRGLRIGTIARTCQPILCGSSLRYMGVQAVLDAVCEYLPSPLEVPPVEARDPRNPEEIVTRSCDPDGPLAVLVFKIVADSHGDLFFLRIYSGTLKAGSRLTNVSRNRKENLPRIYRIFAKRREQIEQAYAGDIVAVIGLKDSITGDTLGDAHKPVLLERIEFAETVISQAIEPKNSADRDKLAAALQMLTRSDPTFAFREVAETGQILISGMGELHLEVNCHRLERDMNVPVKVGKPRVAYRETITTATQHEGRFQRQTGNREQFAVVRLRVEPFEPELGAATFQFRNAMTDDSISPQYLAAIEQGARDAAQSGPLGSYPLINVRVTLLGGEQNDETSSEIAFETATAIGVTQALEKAGPVLLEPIMRAEIVTPGDFFGAINSDLMGRRAVIHGTAMRGSNQVIDCEVPLAAMFGYATHMRSLSQGRASYSMEPSGYQQVPANLTRDIIGVF